MLVRLFLLRFSSSRQSFGSVLISENVATNLNYFLYVSLESAPIRRRWTAFPSELVGEFLDMIFVLLSDVYSDDRLEVFEW